MKRATTLVSVATIAAVFYIALLTPHHPDGCMGVSLAFLARPPHELLPIAFTSPGSMSFSPHASFILLSSTNSSGMAVCKPASRFCGLLE